MNTLTIPKRLAPKNDEVIIPRKEYEALLELKQIKEFVPTQAQKRALTEAEKNFTRKKTLSYYELVKKLGFTH